MTQEEIEFKYLISHLPGGLPPGEELLQAYLPTTDGTTKRIRQHISQAGAIKYYLTLKTRGLIGRQETEQKITAEEFTLLWKQKKTGHIHKQRYTIPLLVGTCQLQAEFDEYFEQLKGLYTVEVEVPDITLRPQVLKALQEKFSYSEKEIIDVTEDKRYKNANLLNVNIQNLIKF
jgi:CYTH domain-containing protein